MKMEALSLPFRNRGIAFIILWVLRTLIAAFLANIIVNTSLWCTFLKVGCVSPSIGVQDIVALIFAIMGGLWVMQGSKFAIWSNAAFVNIILSLDIFGYYLTSDVANLAKVIIDLMALFVLLKPSK